MFKAGIGIVLMSSLIGLAGCAGKAQTIGLASGAALGAAVSDGGALGTVGGALVGYGMGKAYAERRGENR